MIGIILAVCAHDIGVYFRLANPLDCVLVQAVVVDVRTSASSKATVVTAKIIHIYGNRKDLAGRMFTEQYIPLDFSGRSARSPFSVGEVGIWPIIDRGSTVQIGRDRALPFRYRSRSVENPRHNQVLLLAETIEQLYATSMGNRKHYVLLMSQHTIREVSYTFSRVLAATASSAELVAIASRAVKPSAFPITAQVIIDEALAVRHPHDWPSSEIRLAMLRWWVESELNEDDASFALTRLDLAYQGQRLGVSLAVELATTAAANKKWPWSVRRSAFAFVGRLSQGIAGDENAYRWLIAQLSPDSPRDTRWEAALTVRNCVTLYPVRRAEITKLAAAEKDPEVRKFLNEALRPPKQ